MGQDKRIAQYIWWGIAFLGFFACGYICALFYKSPIDYSGQLTLSDILSTLVGAFVTLWAAWYITKKLNEDRYSKELTISDLKEIEESIAYIVAVAQDEPDQTSDIIAKVNRLHGTLSRLERTCKINDKNVSIANVMNRFYCFYGCATNFGDKPLNIPLIVSSGDDLIIEIRTAINRINKL